MSRCSEVNYKQIRILQIDKGFRQGITRDPIIYRVIGALSEEVTFNYYLKDEKTQTMTRSRVYAW